MSEIVFELVCDSCGADYTINYVDGITDYNEPDYCPFCGRDVDLSDVEEDYESGTEEFGNFDEFK
jgi:hypothetical protein